MLPCGNEENKTPHHRLYAYERDHRGARNLQPQLTPNQTRPNFEVERLRRLKRSNPQCNNGLRQAAKVAELADAPDLGSGPARGGGSSPPFRTKHFLSSNALTMGDSIYSLGRVTRLQLGRMQSARGEIVKREDDGSGRPRVQIPASTPCGRPLTDNLR